MSTKIGFAPTDTIEFAVATNVNDGRSTSSPCLMSSEYSAACSAAVPEFTATAYFDLTNEERSFSNSCTLLPPEFAADVREFSTSTALAALISSLPIIGIFIGIFNYRNYDYKYYNKPWSLFKTNFYISDESNWIE